jgi:hypothetical protein
VAVRVNRGLGFALADGHFLAAAPSVARWAPPALFGVGLAGGALTLGYARVFSEALWIVLVAAAAGFLATQLGAAFVAGFAAGDFLVGQRVWNVSAFFASGPLDDGLLAGLLRVRLPMLIGYALLAALAVYLPRLARLLIADIPRVENLPKPAAFGVALALNGLVVAVAVRLWAESSAVLVRPLFTWQGQRVSTVAVAVLQVRASWVVVVALLATVGRAALLWWVYGERARIERVVAVEEAVAQGPGHTPWTERAGPVPTALGAAALTTLVLAGVVESIWVAVALFAVFATLRLLREGLIPPRLDGWKRTAARIPILIRLAVALLVVDTVRRLFVDAGDQTFTPLALSLALSVAVLYLLLPGAPAAPGGPDGRLRA